MLNPYQVGCYRELLLGGNNHGPDGFALSTVEINQRWSAPTSAPGEEGSLISPDIIFGTPTDASCVYGLESHSVEIAAARLMSCDDARIIGNAAVLTLDGRLFRPEPVDLSTPIASVLEQNHWDHEGFILEETEGRVLASFVSRPVPRRLPRTALFLHNMEPGNFGSFMFRQLPQMLAAKSLSIDFDCYVLPDRTPFALEAIRLLGLPERPVFSTREVCGEVFSKVLFHAQVDHGGYLSRQCLSLLGGVVGRVTRDSKIESPSRIYISRALSAVAVPDYRPLLNELEIEELAKQRGYAVVYPETLSLAAQMQTFHSARMIFGPSGSGMFNSVFAPSGARILDMESFTHTVGQHGLLYSSCGHRYAFAFGNIEGGDPDQALMMRPWRMDLRDVDAALDWLES